MAQPVLSAGALADLDDLLDYLACEAGSRVAANYRRDLFHLFELLTDAPALGAPRPSLGRRVRVSVVAPYLVIYRLDGKTPTVLRILHGRRKISGAMLRQRG